MDHHRAAGLLYALYGQLRIELKRSFGLRIVANVLAAISSGSQSRLIFRHEVDMDVA